MLVIGALNRVELWNPAEWETRVRPAEAELTSESDDVPRSAAAADSSTVPEP